MVFSALAINLGLLLLFRNFELISKFDWELILPWWPVLLIFAGIEMWWAVDRIWVRAGLMLGFSVVFWLVVALNLGYLSGWGLDQAYFNRFKPQTMVLTSTKIVSGQDYDIGMGGLVVDVPTDGSLRLEYEVGIGSVLIDGQVVHQGLGIVGSFGESDNTVSVKIGVGRLEIRSQTTVDN